MTVAHSTNLEQPKVFHADNASCIYVGAFRESFVGLERPNYIFDELFLLFSSLLVRLGQGNCRWEPNINLGIL